jgi:hypothetical protein
MRTHETANFFDESVEGWRSVVPSQSRRQRSALTFVEQEHEDIMTVMRVAPRGQHRFQLNGSRVCGEALARDDINKHANVDGITHRSQHMSSKFDRATAYVAHHAWRSVHGHELDACLDLQPQTVAQRATFVLSARGFLGMNPLNV